MSFLKPGPMNTTQRFKRALLFGIPIGIIVGIAHYLLKLILGGFELSLVYIFVGYGVGQAIQYVSHGVGKKFNILAVGVYILALLVTDVVMPSLSGQFSIFAYLPIYLRYLLNPSGLIALLFRVIGGLAAFFSLN